MSMTAAAQRTCHVTKRPSLGWTLRGEERAEEDGDLENAARAYTPRKATRREVPPLHAMLRSARKCVATLVPMIVFVVGPVVLMQPLLTPMLETLAAHFSLGLSVWANSRFVVFMSILSMVPGFPVLAIVATLGGMLPFEDALLVGTCTRHLSACLSFFVGRRFLKSRKDSFVEKWSHLRTIAHMAEIQPWRITFLSRFIMLPEQVKNYSLGALSVHFFTFFWMALLGDLQGTLFAVLVGSLSSGADLVAGAASDPILTENSRFLRTSISVVGMLASVVMMALASLQVKRIHAQCEDDGALSATSSRRRHDYRQRAQSDRDVALSFRHRLRRHSLLENLV